MKESIKIALVGHGYTHAQIDKLQNQKKKLDSQMVGFNFSDDEYYKSILGILSKDKLDKPNIFKLAQRYAVDEFSRVKKPKNQEWQKRIKNLMKL